MQARHVICLGLGTFGAAVAERLAEDKVRVTGVDRDEERVAELQDTLYEALVADATDRRTLEQLPIEKVDAVVVSLGEDFTSSILCCLHLMELNARRVFCKAINRDHAKILEKLGVSDIVFPEVEIARQLAERIAWPNVLQRLALGTGHMLVEIAVPRSLEGKTLRDADLRRRYGINVLGVKDTLRDQEFLINPDPLTRLQEDQILLVVGTPEAIDRFRATD